jgi:type VI secretion system secreted protein Hcp
MTDPLGKQSGLDFYMALKGARSGAIKGDVATVGHVGEIRVLTFKYGVKSRAITGSQRSLVTRDVDPFVMTKPADSSTTKLLAACHSAERLTSAVLTGRKAGGVDLDYFTITLTDAYVQSVDLKVDDEGDLIEEVTLRFKQLDLSYRPQLGTGLLGATSTASVTVYA